MTMFFPKPELPLTIPVIGVLLSGLVATVSYYWIGAKLKNEGSPPTPLFLSIKDVLKRLQTYRRIAPERGWPTWPIVTFWLAMAVAFASAISVYFLPQK